MKRLTGNCLHRFDFVVDFNSRFFVLIANLHGQYRQFLNLRHSLEFQQSEHAQLQLQCLPLKRKGKFKINF